jgi:hypothetical protein
MNIVEIRKELEERLNAYISEINIKMLEYTPFIVEVGALTAGTDDNGVIIVENKKIPTQFSEDAVKIILSMTFKNYNDELVSPKVYNRHEWYSEKIERLKFTIKELNYFRLKAKGWLSPEGD